jgi:hypothetical protein
MDRCNLFCKIKKRLLGELLLAGSFVKKEEIERAIEKQKRNNRLIGELLVELGALSNEELNLVLKFQEDLSNPHRALRFATGLRKRLGELLIEAGRLTEKDLQEALELQRRTNRRLGEILTEKGFLNEKELKALLLFQKTQERDIPEKIKLGELLVSLGIITREQLNEALNIQTLHPEKRIGEILVDLGYATEKDIQKCLTLQQKLATIALSTILVFSNIFYINDLSASDVPAPSTSGKVQIVAEVKSFVKLNLIKQTGALVISEGDIASKTKDLKDATTFEIKTNSRGVLIIFEGFGDGIVDEVEIYGFGETVKIGSGGGMVYIKQPARIMQFNLSYRFRLNENAKPGTYAWPYSLSVSAY